YEIEEHIGALIEEAELPSEAVFNEYRSSADKWIKANSQKINSPRSGSEMNLKETQNKRSYPRPQQRGEKHRDRSIEENTNYKTSNRVNTVQPPAKEKPVPATAQPVPSDAMKADVVNAKQSTEIVQSQDSTAKKSFLQRVLQRIFG
ncbi:MAG: ATP-dependent helicase, partial [Smithella sp.]